MKVEENSNESNQITSEGIRSLGEEEIVREIDLAVAHRRGVRDCRNSKTERSENGTEEGEEMRIDEGMRERGRVER